MKQMLSAAIKFAAVQHDGQFDKQGAPYLLHVLKVMHYLKTDEEELNCIAVLHDVVEDTGATYQDLRAIGMSERVIDGVRILTKLPGQTKEEYLELVLSNPDTRKVKKCDLRHNMDIRRLKGFSDKDAVRLKKYSWMYSMIEEKEKELSN